MGRIPFTARKRSISFVPIRYGLGNRLIPMGCVFGLATEMNYNPIMFWEPDKEVGRASFGDLFESTNLPFELVEGSEARIMGAFLYGDSASISPPKRMGLRLLRSLVLPQYGKRIKFPDGKSEVEFRGRVATDLLSFRKIVLSTFFFIRYRCDVSWLKPVPQIARRVTELKQQFAPNTVGVHFRGTDWRVTHGIIPPVDRIIARMRAEIELDPDVKFFFASDGDTQEEAIVTLFKDRLIKFKKSAQRKTIEGQQEGVVDLFGLAATSRIIGFKYSSFATLAALIGNKPLLRIGHKFNDG